jgi:hypothetical protein
VRGRTWRHARHALLLGLGAGGGALFGYYSGGSIGAGLGAVLFTIVVGAALEG